MRYRIPLLSLIFLSTLAYGQVYHGSITRVIDGDTYVFQTASGSFKVRMLGIDSPEHDQPFSRQSKDFLSGYLFISAVTRVKGSDRYGRKTGTLLIDGQDINLLAVKKGFAWHNKKYLNDAAYANAELSAKKKRLGLWGLASPVAPWMWRKIKSTRPARN